MRTLDEIHAEALAQPVGAEVKITPEEAAMMARDHMERRASSRSVAPAFEFVMKKIADNGAAAYGRRLIVSPEVK